MDGYNIHFDKYCPWAIFNYTSIVNLGHGTNIKNEPSEIYGRQPLTNLK